MAGYGYRTVSLPGRDSLPRVAGEAGPSFINVSPGYFAATGLRMIAGRDFSSSDGSAIVVGATLASSYWPKESPLGKCLVVGRRENACLPVIGVVGDVHRMSVVESDKYAQFYVSDTGSRTTIVL